MTKKYILIHTFLHVHTYLHSTVLDCFFFIFSISGSLHNILRSQIRGTHLNFKKNNVQEKKFWKNFILDVNVSF